MFALHTKMWLLVTALFGIVFAFVAAIGSFIGGGDVYFYLWPSLVMLLIQYLVGPAIVERAMRVTYVERRENPKLFAAVEDLATKAGIPTPRVGIADIPIPNAFAFGRSRRDSRICVTKGLLGLLNDAELRAVLGHEVAHLRNRDVLMMTFLSVGPMIMYAIARSLLGYGGRGRRRGAGQAALVGVAALLLYYVTSLLVLYASRIREYFADRGSVELGNRSATLASSLYKLVYGAARTNRDAVKEAEGFKAFFLNDPSQAHNDLVELREIDVDHSGTVDGEELARLRGMSIRLGFNDRLVEALHTHPNMLNRIKQLSEYEPRARG